VNGGKIDVVSVHSVRTYPTKYLRRIAQIPPWSGLVATTELRPLYSEITDQELETIRSNSRGVFTQTKLYTTIQQDLREEGRWLASQRRMYSNTNAVQAQQSSDAPVTGKRQVRPTAKFLDYVAQETGPPSHTRSTLGGLRGQDNGEKHMYGHPTKEKVLKRINDTTDLATCPPPHRSSKEYPSALASKNEDTKSNYVEQSFEVAAILAKRNRGNITEYCTQWQGYDISHATWEPVQNFESTEMINEFEQQLQKNSRCSNVSLASLSSPTTKVC
jgi:hypothetical protein